MGSDPVSNAETPARRAAAAFRWAPDLGRDIGGMRWFGELAVFLALICAALAISPGLNVALRTGAPVVRDETPSVHASRLISAPTKNDPLHQEMSVLVGPQESLESALLRAGVGSEDAEGAQKLVDAALFPGALPKTLRVAVELEPTSGHYPRERALVRAKLRPRIDLSLTIFRRGTALGIDRQSIAVETTTKRIRGTLDDNLVASIGRAGGAPEVIDQFRTAMRQNSVQYDDLRPGDAFDLVTTTRRAADGAAEVGDVLYASLSRDGRPLVETLRWGSDGQFRTAATVGPGTANAAGIWPVKGRFTSVFGMRFHPILGRVRMHSGVDIGAPAGTPIYAAADGIVVFAGPHGGHGNYVRLEHPDGHGTGYAHMSRIAVVPGVRVTSGQLIGYVGSTGLSTGPHLHYEVYRGGRNVDPATVQIAPRNTAGLGRERFEAAVAVLKALSPVASGAKPAPR